MIPTAEEQMEQIRREAAERKAEKAEEMSRLIAKLDALANARRQAVAANQNTRQAKRTKRKSKGRHGRRRVAASAADDPELDAGRTRSADQEDEQSSVMSEDSFAGNEPDAVRPAPIAASSVDEGELSTASEGAFANFNAA